MSPLAAARSRAGLTEADQAAWAAYARLVRPLAGRQAPAAAASSPAAAADLPAEPRAVLSPSGRAQTRPAPLPSASVFVGTAPGGLDAASWQRLRSGRIPAVRRLDLHGFTAQRAFQAVSHFIRVAHADHVRCVEIVTGRGEGEGGVLRRELPVWLNLPELRPLVLAAVHPHPTNQGAMRLLLRRVR